MDKTDVSIIFGALKLQNMIKRFILLLSIIFISSAVYSQVASFSAAQTAGCPNPFLMILNSTSTGGPFTSYNWTMTGPAGFVPPAPGLTNQYTQALTIPGFYTITLTVCAGPGNCNTFVGTNYIQVYEKPTISLNVSPTSACPGELICFTGTATPNCDTLSSLFIDLKDGTILNDFGCHAYTSTGTYSNFVISATNGCGCTTTQTSSTSVSITPSPVANFTSTQASSCTAPLNVTLSNTSTNTVPGTIYTWNIPGVLSNVHTPNITQSFPVGVYSVQLIVQNPNGCSDTIFRPNYISVGNPTANFTSNVTTVCPGGSVSFTNLSSGTPSSVLWTFEGHGTSTILNPSKAFTTPGTWDVTLIANYAGGCSDTFVLPNYITVNSQPVNNFTVSDSSSCSFPFTTTFTNASTNANTTNWTFPGGTPATATGNGPINVTYNAAGNYNVTMSSISSQGCSRSNTFTNVISVQGLQAQITVDSMMGCTPINATFAYTLNLPETVTSNTWTLTGSDIGTSTLLSPLAVYNTAGCFDASLTISTASGCSVTVTSSNIVCASNAPTGSFSATPNVLCFEEEEVCVNYIGSTADSLWWDFGDPSPPVWSSANGTICHSYSDELGDFTITMVPFNQGCQGDSVIFVDTVHVVGPIAAFSSAFDGCDTWNTFNFTDESTDADSVYYVFGDPNSNMDTSSARNPQWIYPTINAVTTYTITQYAYSFVTGCEHEVSHDIQVYPPNADFTYSDSVGCAPKAIVFNNTSFFVAGGLNCRWNWNGTNTYAGPAGGSTGWTFGASANRSFTIPGLYSVGMRNQDNRGCIDTLFMPNLIAIHGITGGFTTNVNTGCAPLQIDFTSTAVAPISYIASYHWNFGDPTTTADTSNLPNPTYVYNNIGVYTTTLTVVDSFGCQKVITGTVTVLKPTIAFTVSDTFICNNQSISISNTSTGSGLVYDWQFTNASPSSNASANPPPVTFNTEGIQTVTLSISDISGCTIDSVVNIHVFDVVPDGIANTDSIGCFANVVPVIFTNTSYNNADPSTIWWDLGNGTSSTLPNPSAIYDLAGTYYVSMSISSFTGCRDTSIIDTISVGGPYANIAVLNEDTSCFCHTVEFAITTWNTNSFSFIPGDGNIVTFTPNGILGDTIIDTLQYQYCSIGAYVPQVFIDDGNCSGNVFLNDTLLIDSIVVDFTFDDSNLCDSGQVCFTDLSYSEVVGANDVATWLWNFGDGNTSIVQNPCHYYNTPGLFDVTLISSNLTGCEDTIVQQVYIPFSPKVEIARTDSNGCLNVSAMFWDSTSIDSNALVHSWHWDFGDLSVLTDTANTQDASFIFTQIGLSYTSLIVVDTFGCIGSDSVLIEVFNLPIVQAGLDPTICIFDSAQLTASGAQSYVWTPNLFISDTSAANPFVFPALDQSYFLQGTDTNGCTNYDTVSVSVNQISAFFSSQAVCFGDTSFMLDLSSSDGTLNSWTWNFDDPTSGTSNVSTLQNPGHVFSGPGTYNVSLTTGDSNACQDDTIVQVLVSQAPTASFTSAPVCFGTTSNFNSSSSNPAGGTIIRYHWDFGIATSLSDTSNLPNPSFNYSSPGIYTVCLSVTTDQLCAGNFDDTCFAVQVYNLPIANFSTDSTCLGSPSSFIDLSQNGGDGAIVSSLWNFGQNPGDTLELASSPVNTSFTYASFGSYAVSLNVRDIHGCVAQSSENAFVFDNPSAAFNGLSYCQNADNTFISLPLIGLDSLSDLQDYYWNFDEGTGFVLGDSIQEYNFFQSGNHTISHVVTTSFGCSDTVQQLVFINVAPNAVITGDNTVCLGYSTNLDGSSSTVSVAPATYNWSVSSGQTSNITYLPNADGPVSLVVIDGNSCSDSTFIFLDVLANPNVDFEWTDACETLPFTLTSLSLAGDGALTSFAWEISSPNIGLSNLNGQDVPFIVPNEDTLKVVLIVGDVNGCIDSLVQTVFVDQQVSLTILAGDTFICPGNSILFDLNDSTQFISSGVGSLVWSPTSSLDDPNATQVLASPTLPTTYNVIALSTLNQCPPDDSNDIFVDVAPDPIITLEAVPNPVVPGSVSSIEALVVPFDFSTDSLNWTDPNGTLNYLYGFNVEATPLEATTYPIQLVYLYHGYYCTKDTSITINIIDVCGKELVYAPNIFTPNDDSKNDVFKIGGYGIQVFNFMRVFDRWGQLMYEGNGLEVIDGRMLEGWDGRNKGGQTCNSGVYVYTYELICTNGDVVTGSGNVTLIK